MTSYGSSRLWYAALAAIAWFAGDSTSAFAQSRWAIYVMNVDGSGVKKVSRLDDRPLGSPSWSHDGETLLFNAAARNGQFNQGNIFRQRLDANTAENLGIGMAPHFSPDDQQIAFYMGEGNLIGAKPGVYVMNADGSGREWLCEGDHPRWSPDGERIALVSGHEGFPGLYIFDTITLERKRVLFRGYDMVIGASWSNDGEELVFIGKKEGKSEVAIVRAAVDQLPKTVYQGIVGWQPDWSPVDKRLLFWIRSGNQERLHILDIAGEKPPLLIPDQISNRNSGGVFSPDGKKIAFSSDRNG
jgi:Tol biopolymer transport system component